MIIRETEDFLDYRGWCEGCDHPKFRMLFGPLRYPKANWQGQDIVNEPFCNSNVYSHKAFELLKSFNKQITKFEPIILE